MPEVWAQIRKGWYEDPSYPKQEGGWKAADCSKLVAHAIGEMNKWVKDRDKVLSGKIGALVVPEGYDADDASPLDDVEDGVEEQMDLEGPEWEDFDEANDGSHEIEP